MRPKKPYRLRKWQLRPPRDGVFFTCARPGRNAQPSSKHADVPDADVIHWVFGLPGPNTAIVSLLGTKPDGSSEFRFYSFRGAWEDPSDGSESFAEWLFRVHRDLNINVCEHPTTDLRPMDLATLDVVAKSVYRLISEGRTVVVVDSGGEQRTGQLCKHMGASETSAV